MIDGKNSLFVFTNSRKIREFNSKFEDELIPKALTIAEFEKKAVFVKDRFEADPTYLLVLMQKAAASVKDANLKLKIPNEFFAFLKNNDYLFSFFKELAIQKRAIADIKFSDIYADFEEHLDILEAVLKEYKTLLENEALYDDITLCEIYELNSEFVCSYDEIIIEIDGFLSEFEWELIGKISNLTTLKLIFQTSKYNKKSVEKIAQISSLDIENFTPYTKFELNLSDKTLKALEKIERKRLIETRSFGVRSLQCAYAMAKVSEFVREGIAPEKIAVILPDESFGEILKLHDFNKIFNFAAGESFERSGFFQILSFINEAINDKVSINLDPENFLKFNEFEFILSSFGVSGELFNKFKNGYETACSFEKFKEPIDEILALQSDARVQDLVAQELFFIKNLSRYFSFSLRQIFEIFLMRLKNLSLDDVGGGKVSVLGVLESRGMKFDGVVVLDFNDDLIPKRSVNEMFLNSRVREKAGLISYTERENLQRFYYESLINSAKKVAISYVLNEEKIASRFLNEFSMVEDVKFSDESYAKALGGSSFAALKDFDDEVVLRHDFFAKPLSFSRLNTFLKCARKYYYAYIMGVKPASMSYTKKGFEDGKALHEALCEYYQKFNEFDLNEFKKLLSKKDIAAIEFEILSVKFEKFSEVERARFKEGWRVAECEKQLENRFCGVDITGVIDRIDVKDDEMMLIDYKSGRADKKSLQLPFYQALVGKECKTCYYDLKTTMELVENSSTLHDLYAEIENLKQINDTRINFARNISSECRYCEFKTICKGEL
ncbi:PD-(D/E)XK nuclease family protein [Campylobacter sp.]|uniref:PD-(D/E)XK nuclease family protein n=1 Tax=Campylobacter sp. TaxID=205 RepID=UPI0026FCA6B1|nr:PD-(D/E)XK nuclease family protein [Campylobacter sp.]